MAGTGWRSRGQGSDAWLRLLQDTLAVAVKHCRDIAFLHQEASLFEQETQEIHLYISQKGPTPRQ